MANRNLTEQVKIGLAMGAILAALVAFVFARLKDRAEKNKDAADFIKNTPVVKIGKWVFNAHQSFMAALLLLALFGTFNYNRYNSNLLLDGYDEYDLLHYYISPKYFDEIGYFRLLPAIIIADYESGPMCPKKAPVYLAQDENDYTRRSVSHALAQTDEVKSHFTDEKWQEFVHDVTYIQRHSKRLKCFLYRQLLQDHGFNGTPTWVLIARPIVKLVPVEFIKLATSLDLLWIIAMLASIVWAFGLETALLAWIFITISYSFRWPTITWALLRYDWFATMVIGICMIKKEKNAAGGAFFAYATLMRYFPVLWLFGIVAKGVHALITALINKSVLFDTDTWLGVPKRYFKMLGGFAAAMTLLLGLSFAVDGVEPHKASFNNMFAHVEAHNLSSMRQGLQVALTYRGETDLKLISTEKKEMVEENETIVRIGSLLMMLVLGLFMSRAKDWEVVGLGLIPYFWLTTSSYYYYSMRMTAVVIHAGDLKKSRNIVGLTILFGIELFCHAAQYLMPGNRYFLICVMGVLLAIYSLVMMIFLGVEWWKGRRHEPIKEEVADAR